MGKPRKNVQNAEAKVKEANRREAEERGGKQRRQKDGGKKIPWATIMSSLRDFSLVATKSRVVAQRKLRGL
jgi:hypothetical protein